jgi:rRNA-processing protein FCF1
MADVVCDTNALMMPVESNVRLFAELERLLDAVEPVVPAAVVDELAALAEGRGDEGTAASVGLDLATERCRAVETDADYADDAVLEVATRAGVDYAVTNDLPLRDRLLDAGVPVIGLRGQHKLAITQP